MNKMTTPYQHLNEFAKTLPEDKQKWFTKMWCDTVRYSPRVYSLLNTPEEWTKIYTRLEHCHFMCTRGCEKAVTPDIIGGTRPVGCSMLAGDAA